MPAKLGVASSFVGRRALTVEKVIGTLCDKGQGQHQEDEGQDQAHFHDTTRPAYSGRKQGQNGD